MQHSLGITSKEDVWHQKLQLGRLGERIATEAEGSKVTSINVKKHIEDDLLKDLNLNQEDLNDIKFYKKKLIIDEFFKKEKQPEKRKEIYQKLIKQFHPDKNQD